LQQILRQNQKHIKIAKTATKSHTHTKLQKLRQTNTQKLQETATKSTHPETQKRTTIPKHRNQLLCKFRKINKQKGGHNFIFFKNPKAEKHNTHRWSQHKSGTN
jgi:hypothetical protein